MGLEVYNAKTAEELSGLVKRHAEAVRRLPGLAQAEAIVVVESNQIMVADGVYAELGREGGRHPLDRATLLHLDPNKRAVTVDGWLNPGLRTTEQNKPEMMDRIKRMLERDRIHWHSQLVAYATRDTEREERMLQEMGGDLQAVWSRFVLAEGTAGAVASVGLLSAADVFLAEARQRVTSLMIRELANMARIARPVGTAGTSGSAQQRLQQQMQMSDVLKYKYTGKLKTGDTDDCVMALGIGIVALVMHEANRQAMARALGSQPGRRF